MSSILNERLPNIELSYGTKLHKKVHADLYQIIPKGKRCLLWYTYWNEHNVCYLLHLGNNDKYIDKVEKTISSFSNELCYGTGTILSGTLFHHNNVRTFAIVDVLFYKGCNIQNNKYETKLDILSHILSSHINHDIYVKSQLLVAGAVITKTYKEAIDVSKSLPYNVHALQLINYNMNKCVGFYNYYVGAALSDAFFKVKPLLTCDIYELSVMASDKIHGYAAITDYKTSVMMNNIFRNIKENSNLDLLEESDEESDFENVNPNKYVNLNESKIMRCVYVPRFKKWKPVSVCPSNTKLSSIQEVLTIEKKYHTNIYDKLSKSIPDSRILQRES